MSFTRMETVINPIYSSKHYRENSEAQSVSTEAFLLPTANLYRAP